MNNKSLEFIAISLWYHVLNRQIGKAIHYFISMRKTRAWILTRNSTVLSSSEFDDYKDYQNITRSLEIIALVWYIRLALYSHLNVGNEVQAF